MRLIDADAIDFRGVEPELNKDKIHMIPLVHAKAVINTAPTINADDYFDAVDKISGCPNCRYTHIFRMISKNGLTPWESVKDKLPNKSGEYLTYHIDPISSIGWFSVEYYSARHQKFNAFDELEEAKYASNSVTHWMHLPISPEEVQTQANMEAQNEEVCTND